MKTLSRISLLAGFLLLVATLPAQHNFEFYNNGAVIFVAPNTDISVMGDMHHIGGTVTNNGTIEVQGNLYGNSSHQQRGTGTVRLENNDVNTTERQFIEGDFAVRGGTSQIGADDGSFYDLELANTQGIVWLSGAGNVADVRNSVDFQPAAAAGSPPLNRLVTGFPAPPPANGSAYPAVFGMMNSAPGLGNFLNNTITTNGNSSGTDAGYVQGRLRRAVAASGGTYGYVMGLEPAGAGAARGVQYTALTLGLNNYDVIEGYFEQGSPNVMPNPVDCGYTFTYFAGNDHGEWNFNDINGTGTGAYILQIWPQDYTAPAHSIWVITKDDTLHGLLGNCGPTPVGLLRPGLDGFSEFGFAGTSTIFPIVLADIRAYPVNNKWINVDWSTALEENVDRFEVERSTDNLNFDYLQTTAAVGNSSTLQSYGIEDRNVIPNIDYHYRLKIIDRDGSFEYTNSVTARLLPDDEVQISLYPNPTDHSDVNLDVVAGEASDADLTVYDELGKRVYARQLEIRNGLNQFRIPAAALAAGVYIVRLDGQRLHAVRKLVVR